MTLRPAAGKELIRARAPGTHIYSQNRSPPRRGRPQGFSIQTSQQIGKYFIAPRAHREDGGSYTASVSIRSGRASMSHDRVMRFVPLFDSHDAASRYAVAQALAWVDAIERDDGTGNLDQLYWHWVALMRAAVAQARGAPSTNDRPDTIGAP